MDSTNLNQEIWKETVPYLKKGRTGDLEHTLRTLKIYSILSQYEKSNPIVCVPALMMHDIGYFEDPEMEGQWELHMKRSADIAKSILHKVGYTTLYDEKIIRIISIHDEPGKIFEWGDIDGILVAESDRLDRYVPQRFNGIRHTSIFSRESDSDTLEWLKGGKSNWFKSTTAKALVNMLYQGMVDYINRFPFNKIIPNENVKE